MHVFLYNQHICEQRQAGIGKIRHMLSSNVRLNLYSLEIIYILHSRYHPKMIF